MKREFMWRCIPTLLLAFCGALPAAAQSVPADPNFQKLEFVLGDWAGVADAKDTPHGAGQGDCSFTSELNGKIIVRRSFAAYEAGARHDDLMVIYLDAPGQTPHAIFFDSEGHVIRYNLKFPETNRAVFESDGSSPGPRYRLTYWLSGRDLNGSFEIAPPGSDFKPYLTWTSRKK